MSGDPGGATGWQYASLTWDPQRDDDEQAWARGVAAHGWRTWLDSSGVWADINGRRVRVWSLRRPCVSPFTVHDHHVRCALPDPGRGGDDDRASGATARSSP